MSLRALRTLVAIAKHGSFARAGDAVGLTQSAVSLQVRGLEAEFGAELFDRSRRRPTLTDAGRVALARAQEVLAIYDAIPEDIASPGGVSGSLRVGAIQTVLAGILPDALVSLGRAHPGLRVRVSSGLSAELAAMVDLGDIDAALVTAPVRPLPKALAWAELYRDRFWVVAPPAATGATARELLEAQPFLRFDRRAWAGRMVEDALRRQRIRVHDEMELDSQDAILLMASKGLGAAVLPLRDPDLARLPPVRLLPFGHPQMARGVGVLQRALHPRRNAVAALLAALREAARAAEGTTDEENSSDA